MKQTIQKDTVLITILCAALAVAAFRLYTISNPPLLDLKEGQCFQPIVEEPWDETYTYKVLQVGNKKILYTQFVGIDTTLVNDKGWFAAAHEHPKKEIKQSDYQIVECPTVRE